MGREGEERHVMKERRKETEMRERPQERWGGDGKRSWGREKEVKKRRGAMKERFDDGPATTGRTCHSLG